MDWNFENSKLMTLSLWNFSYYQHSTCYDFVDTTLFWADSCRFGDGGWNICPQENVPLWFWFAAPTYYRYTDEQWLKIGMSGKISIP
ncbi:hypothetical protein J7M00_04350 [bacterium]|nr:hypothetical protein [bacterium]